MADITRSQDARSQILGAGDSYVTLATTVEQAGTTSLATKFGVHVVCQAIPNSSPTDDIVFSLYGAHTDDEVYDTVALSAVTMDTATATGTSVHQISFALAGQLPEAIKVGAKQDGSTDTNHTVRIYVKPWDAASA